MSTRDVTSAPDRPWKPAVPLSAVIGGRVFLGVLEALAVGVVLAIWSALTRAGLTYDQISGFAILTTAVYDLTRDTLVGFRWLGVSFRWYCGVGGLVVGH